MAGDTVAHVERAHLDHLAHLSNVAVAGGTIKAGSEVRLVNEMHMIRQPVQAHPVDRLLLQPRLAHLLDLRLAGTNNGVAEHALLHLRVAGSVELAGSSMAERTVQPSHLDMDAVIEIDGLRRRGHGLMGKDPGSGQGEKAHRPAETDRWQEHQEQATHLR